MAFVPGTAASVTTTVELRFKARNLMNLDWLSKSDPQIHVFQRDSRSGKWLAVGKTEVIDDNLNPDFATGLKLAYRFEEVQALRFVCVDIDTPGARMEEQELVGTMECSLGDIIGSKGGQLARQLLNPKYAGQSCGVLIVSAEECSDAKGEVMLEFHARNLDKKNWFGGSDPFLRIQRSREGGQYDAVHKTEVIKSNINPQWQRFKISLQALCNGDPHRTLLIQCFDWNKDGTEILIGQCQTSVAELERLAKSRGGLDLKDPAKASKKSYVNSGVLHVVMCDVTTVTFLDYIRGGLEIALVMGIDFTASNGNPMDPNSLHYMGDPRRPNQYIQAIQSVATVLASYDTDHVYPVYGFGARLPPHGQVSHCFPLSGNPAEPGVHGIDGVLASYANTIRNVQLYGPTNFSQLIEAAAQIAQAENQYTILLILTDGVISDMDATIDVIVAASVLPLSIVIVGVGNADFSLMERLDADVTPLVDRRGRKMARDIVQFVPMREFANQIAGAIAEATLEEIPGQIVGYMRANGIAPRPPLRADSLSTLNNPPYPTPQQSNPPYPAPQQSNPPYPTPQQNNPPYPTPQQNNPPYPPPQHSSSPYPAPYIASSASAPYPGAPGNAPPYPMGSGSLAAMLSAGLAPPYPSNQPPGPPPR